MTMSPSHPTSCGHGVFARVPVFARIATLSAFVALSWVASSCERQPIAPVPAAHEVVLGGLFSLTGNWSTLGRTGSAAMELAVEDVNAYLASNAAGNRFLAAIEDTRLDPDSALVQARALKARGAEILIGPQSSDEVQRLKPFVDANGMLLVSPSSTAGSLAIAGDNIFRFTPSDTLEGVAISALMWQDGKRTIIPVWRDDAGNAGLERATRTAFTALGGTVLAGMNYGASTADFTAFVRDLSNEVRLATSGHDPASVGVYLAAFDIDAVALFSAAAADSVLKSVRWYGSDGVARADALLANRDAADFAMRVGYPNPLFGLVEDARDVWEPLSARIRARANAEPDAFALAVYDAVWVVAGSYAAAGATPSADQLKQAFTTAASNHFGATGWTVLNAAGDRKYGDFDYWAVREVDGAPKWVPVGHYETQTGRLVR
jgi:branched-chain amino acid transport system substrate-binding protein